MGGGDDCLFIFFTVLDGLESWLSVNPKFVMSPEEGLFYLYTGVSILTAAVEESNSGGVPTPGIHSTAQQ